MASPGRNIALETAGKVFPPAVFIKFSPAFYKGQRLGAPERQGTGSINWRLDQNRQPQVRRYYRLVWETARGASPPSAGNNDQRLAPRSKATAVSAARVGWGNRKGSRCKAFRYVPPEHPPMDIWRLSQRKGPRLNRGSFLVRHGFI